MAEAVAGFELPRRVAEYLKASGYDKAAEDDDDGDEDEQEGGE